MDMKNIPFGITDWAQIDPTQHAGETGMATWRAQQFDNIRVRMVEYSPGYLADHWCTKGHILLCLEGELHTELADGRKFIRLSPDLWGTPRIKLGISGPFCTRIGRISRTDTEKSIFKGFKIRVAPCHP